MLEHALDQAARYIADADGLLIAAGAGMGVDSGLPDFRGNEGFWKAYPALSRAGIDFQSIASPATFARDPALAWGFYGHRLALYRKTQPHAGFALLHQWAEKLPRWAQRLSQGAFIYTSNVDGQFQKAWFGQNRIHECHGSIHHLQCTRPCSQDIWPAVEVHPVVDEEQCRWLGELPRCPRCGAPARPNILMFWDAEWLSHRSDEQESRLNAWLQEVQRPVVVELGAGTHISTVRRFSESVLKFHHGRLVRINPREAQVPAHFEAVGLPLGALAGLEALAPRLG